jgi:hypothetical protein
MTMLDTLPLSLVGIGIFVVLWIAVEIGFRGRTRFDKAERPQHDGESFLLSAALGLLALLLAFTFSLALDRYDTRRTLVLQEANALNIVRLQVAFMPEPLRTQTNGVLRAYVVERLRWSKASTSEAESPGTIELRRRLWLSTAGLLTGREGPEFLGPDMRASLAHSFNLAEARIWARQSHVPARVIRILLLDAILTSILLGYVLEPTRKRHRVAATLLLTLLTISLVLILDIDQPRSGSVQVSQEPMERLLQALDQPQGPPLTLPDPAQVAAPSAGG